MRGAVSVALVYYYYDSDEVNRDHATLVSMTLVVVLISTLVFGAATKPLLDYMLGADGKRTQKAHVMQSAPSNVLPALGPMRAHLPKGSLCSMLGAGCQDLVKGMRSSAWAHACECKASTAAGVSMSVVSGATCCASAHHH